MYNLSQLLKGVRNPNLAVVELYTLYQRRLLGNTGINVMDCDWDNLIILDACRFDLFEKVHNLPGQLSSVISAGSTTGEFLEANFRDDQFPDTVYVSANPQFQFYELGGSFHADVQLWKEDWDEDIRTVCPGVVKERTKAVASEFPNKRIIVHFVQPHYPFLAETGRQLEHDGFIRDSPGLDEEFISIWDRLERGELSEETVWQAYRENLEIVLPHVDALIDDFVGKTVVTSDHGNAFGKWGLYGHPGGYSIDALVKIPWLESQFTKRKDIVPDDLRTSDSADENRVAERLAALGYN